MRNIYAVCVVSPEYTGVGQRMQQACKWQTDMPHRTRGDPRDTSPQADHWTGRTSTLHIHPLYHSRALAMVLGFFRLALFAGMQSVSIYTLYLHCVCSQRSAWTLPAPCERLQPHTQTNEGYHDPPPATSHLIPLRGGPTGMALCCGQVAVEWIGDETRCEHLGGTAPCAC